MLRVTSGVLRWAKLKLNFVSSVACQGTYMHTRQRGRNIGLIRKAVLCG